MILTASGGFVIRLGWNADGTEGRGNTFKHNGHKGNEGNNSFKILTASGGFVIRLDGTRMERRDAEIHLNTTDTKATKGIIPL
jgi:hypothetical protein